MAKDNKDKELFCNGCAVGVYPAKEQREKKALREYLISTEEELLAGWLEHPENEQLPEIIEIGGEYYKKIKMTRIAGEKAWK